MIPAWDPSYPWPGSGRELLIVGPPGTGKTRSVLTHYVWPALESGGVVLATSYTKAAAKELRERTAKQLGGGEADYRESLSTIHSEASRRCKRLGFRFSKGGRVVVGPKDEEDWTQALDEQCGRGGDDYSRAWDMVRNVWPQDRHAKPIDRLSRIYSGDKLEEAAEWVRIDMHGRYDETGKLVNPDFTGLVEQALVNGEDRSLDLLAVDEAQDLTPLQWALVDRWAATAKRLLVVGDPDQAIYGWAGADGNRLLSWLRARREARRLARSWRVPERAYRLARRVVVKIGDRVDAPYEPAERGGSVRECGPGSALSQAEGVQDDGGTVLVLSRTRKGCATVVDELIELGIPHAAERGRRILHPGGNALEIAEALNAMVFHRGRTTVARAKKIVAALSSKGPMLEGRRGAKTALTRELEAKTGGVRLSWFADRDLDATTLARQWEDPDDEWWCSCLLASKVNARDLLIIREWLAFHGSVDALMSHAGRLVVTTAHASKGREADLVVLDARAKMYFGKRTKPGDLQTIEQRIDEDLRCLYVAVTRTRQDLAIIRGEYGTQDWLDLHGLYS